MSDRQEPNVSRQATVLMLLTNAYDPDPRVRQEALALINLGCRVRLLAWDRDRKAPADQVMEGVEVERVFLSSKHGRGTTQLFFYAMLYLDMLWRGLRTRFDVVHCHDLDTLPLGYMLGLLKRKPVVYDAHESFPDMVKGSVHPIVFRTLVGLENFLIRRIGLLITVGEKLREFFAERGASHTAVVGNWKKLEDYRRTREENRAFRERLGIPPDAVVITCITQLLRNRMIEELLDATAAFPDVYVIVAGKGELADVVQKRAAENPRIIYPGFIHASEVAAYTCASDVIYCGFDPSMPNFRFAAPNKLYEALAAGKPLITPDLGEIGHLVRTHDCGVVMPDCGTTSVRNAIEAMRNTELRARWTRNTENLGRMEMTWNSGAEVLRQQYSRWIPSLGNRSAEAAPGRSAQSRAASVDMPAASVLIDARKNR